MNSGYVLIRLASILFCRDDLEVPGNVKATNVWVHDGNDMIDFVLFRHHAIELYAFLVDFYGLSSKGPIKGGFSFTMPS